MRALHAMDVSLLVFLLAGESGSEEDVQVCLEALHQMRWAFSKKEEREKTIQMVWEARKSAEVHGPGQQSSGSSTVHGV